MCPPKAGKTKRVDESSGLWGIKTPWTLLLGADPKHQSSLERLLTIYFEPVYTFYRASGLSEHDAEDLAQHLLMDFFLVRASHKNAQPAKGRFRNYLLASARHALLDHRKRHHAKRRGGSRKHLSLEALRLESGHWEPRKDAPPEKEFERTWALATWHAALKVFREQQPAPMVEALELYYEQELSQEEAARKLGISLAAFNSRLYTARQKLFGCLKELVRTTVDGPAEMRSELDYLKELLEQSGI